MCTDAADDYLNALRAPEGVDANNFDGQRGFDGSMFGM